LLLLDWWRHYQSKKLCVGLLPWHHILVKVVKLALGLVERSLGLQLNLIPIDCVWGKAGREVVVLMQVEAAFVAAISEGVIEILASDASPVSWSRVARLILVLAFRGLFLWPLLFALMLEGLGSLLSCPLQFGQFHMCWLSFDVILVSLFLASEALFSALEIVV